MAVDPTAVALLSGGLDSTLAARRQMTARENQD